MELEQAKLVLNCCIREELRDHAFGDAEVFWFKNGHEIAHGYIGGGQASVSLTPQSTFYGASAEELLKCGTLGHVERNDETGPDDFVPGRTMPGLTKEAVLKEITTP